MNHCCSLCLFVFLFKVSVIKAKIHESVGMPPGKQKLQLDVSFCIFLLMNICIKIAADYINMYAKRITD